MSSYYDVLLVVQSESHPDKHYEIRKSHRDGKVYCSCPAWVFKARKGDGICKHIRAYMDNHREQQVVVMTQAEFNEFRRAMPQLAVKKVRSTEVKRNYGEAL